jgi:ADP-ribosylation factor-like protein 2-binding protein
MEEELFDGSEEDFTCDYHNDLPPEDLRFDSIVEQLQDIVIEPQFNSLQNGFLNENCIDFDFEEENKIEYMTIFKEYQDALDDYL